MRQENTTENGRSSVPLDKIVMQNGSVVKFVKSCDDKPFVGTGKIFFCPECGCPTNEKTGAIMCECFA
ncbi:MAG: hypothetical protein KKG47_00295 [Proteobacteria bacterium]|nr:hypothetical protein [Pseudomonadota bacterium]MBU1737177.1 hypothetical protein [Pseudomonadota bacterium]